MAKKQLGELRKEPDGYSIKLERHLDYPVLTVWDAITNPEKLAVWFMDLEMELQAGAKMTLRFNDEDKTVTYGKIVQVVPGKLFEFLWLNDDGPDEHARWELFEEGPSKCRLVLTYSRLADKYAINVSAGWHVMLNHLEKTLDGRMEQYPYDGGESDEQRAMVEAYARVWASKFQPFQLSDYSGTIRPEKEGYSILFERILHHPVNKVWEAITVPALLNKWLCPNREKSSTSVDLKPGGKVHLQLMMALIEGTIDELREGVLVQYHFEGGSSLRWELFKEGKDGCRLVLTAFNTGLDGLEQAAAGWHGYLDFLSMVLEEKQVPGFPVEGWSEMARDIIENYTHQIKQLKL